MDTIFKYVWTPLGMRHVGIGVPIMIEVIWEWSLYVRMHAQLQDLPVCIPSTRGVFIPEWGPSEQLIARITLFSN